jgi:hypothetical protein
VFIAHNHVGLILPRSQYHRSDRAVERRAQRGRFAVGWLITFLLRSLSLAYACARATATTAERESATLCVLAARPYIPFASTTVTKPILTAVRNLLSGELSNESSRRTQFIFARPRFPGDHPFLSLAIARYSIFADQRRAAFTAVSNLAIPKSPS